MKITTVGFEYDLGKQVTQIDNFIAAGVDLILLNPGDPKAIGPAIKKAQAAGIIVVAVDTAAEGADATVTTNNVQAGEISCQYIVDKLGGKGDVIIENGPQVSAVIDRVAGCKNVFARNPGIKVLSSDQDGKGSREGGLTVTQGYLTRFAKIDAIFAINDPQAIGTDLAARQQQRTGIIITAVDGAPDIEAALKDPQAKQIQASASQDPFFMARRAVQLGVGILNGQKPASTVELLPSKLDHPGQCCRVQGVDLGPFAVAAPAMRSRNAASRGTALERGLHRGGDAHQEGSRDIGSRLTCPAPEFCWKSDKMRILFIGDVVGKAGIDALSSFLPPLLSRWNVDVTIVNGENSADAGFGITRDTYRAIRDAGADAVTLGNHSWNRKEALEIANQESRLIRPINYVPGTPGSGLVEMTPGKESARW